MITYLEKRWGGGVENPAEKDLLEALSELKKPDPEHPDCWLSDENGWTVAAHESGKVVLENPEGDDGPWHISNVDHDFVLRLWQHLQAGDISTIRQHPWKEGYN